MLIRRCRKCSWWVRYTKKSEADALLKIKKHQQGHKRELPILTAKSLMVQTVMGTEKTADSEIQELRARVAKLEQIVAKLA